MKLAVINPLSNVKLNLTDNKIIIFGKKLKHEEITTSDSSFKLYFELSTI